ncbi:MAG: translation initiation factor IF-1 [Cyanobacteria bacterium P01_F01_bin.86]
MTNYFIETEGVVTESLPNAVFRVQLDNEAQVLGNLSRQMRKNYIPVAIGDRVKVELTTHKSTQGCITHRVLA